MSVMTMKNTFILILSFLLWAIYNEQKEIGMFTLVRLGYRETR